MNSSKHPCKVNNSVIKLVNYINLLSWYEYELHLTDISYAKEIEIGKGMHCHRR